MCCGVLIGVGLFNIMRSLRQQDSQVETTFYGIREFSFTTIWQPFLVHFSKSDPQQLGYISFVQVSFSLVGLHDYIVYARNESYDTDQPQ